jgi:hypothetical protein
LDRRLDEPQSRSGRGGEEKNLQCVFLKAETTFLFAVLLYEPHVAHFRNTDFAFGH